MDTKGRILQRFVQLLKIVFQGSFKVHRHSCNMTYNESKNQLYSILSSIGQLIL